ncbi:hypothetical protein [Huaxiibacter chinensis]|uniref:hypothetical protein n=1 Tax=Huaxiibacter chinensis TaxID=2899785 RepID=UPI003F967526
MNFQSKNVLPERLFCHAKFLKEIRMIFASLGGLVNMRVKKEQVTGGVALQGMPLSE